MIVIESTSAVRKTFHGCGRVGIESENKNKLGHTQRREMRKQLPRVCHVGEAEAATTIQRNTALSGLPIDGDCRNSRELFRVSVRVPVFFRVTFALGALMAS